MRLLLLAALLTSVAAASTLGEVIQRVRGGLTAHQADAEIAAMVRDAALSERLEDAAIEQLQSEGAGSLTVEELERQRDLSEKLPRATLTLYDAPPAPAVEEQTRLIGQVRGIAEQY